MAIVQASILAAVVLAAAGGAEPCRPVDGLEPLLKPGTLLLLGEIHGTEESPAFTGDVACHAARGGLPVIVGLELPGSEQERIDTFLDSSGTETDRRTLLASPWWNRDFQDGRTSVAMADLIDRLRRLRAEGSPVNVVAFDVTARRGGAARDRGMAENLAAAIAASPKSIAVALAGNVHARIERGSHFDADFEPMGYLLSRDASYKRLIALNAAHGPGTAWICAPRCGAVALKGRHGDKSWAVEVGGAGSPEGYSGWYHVGEITASPPARGPAPDEDPGSSAAAPSAPSRPSPAPAPTRSASRAPARSLDGAWQAFDYGLGSKSWAFRFGEGTFRAEGNGDDWYTGRVTVDAATEPGHIDFAIEDCRDCPYKGQTSHGIYRWDGNTLVVSAPRPGSPRPARFVETSGQMMRLVRTGQDRPSR